MSEIPKSVKQNLIASNIPEECPPRLENKSIEFETTVVTSKKESEGKVILIHCNSVIYGNPVCKSCPLLDGGFPISSGYISAKP